LLFGLHAPVRYVMTMAFVCLLALVFPVNAIADARENQAETGHPAGKQAGSYESPLPVELSSSPDMCAYAPCRDIFPGADRFSERKGRPAYVEAYHDDQGEQKLLGYVFLSTDIV